MGGGGGRVGRTPRPGCPPLPPRFVLPLSVVLNPPSRSPPPGMGGQ